VTVAHLPPPVVDAAWAAAHATVLADVRWYLDGRSGRDAFEQAHVPGAVYVDLDTVLSSTDKGGPAGRHPLPSPEDFAAGLGALGIGPDDVVVAYDDAGGGTAGRLVVMLRWLGRPAALLDGGLAAWPAPPESGPAAGRASVDVPVEAWPSEALADADDVVAVIERGGTVLDARAAERYRGDTEPVDRAAGHVPGARNAPWAANLDAGTKHFLGADELRARFEALGVAAGGETVCYCGSGVSACADVLAIERAGLGRPRLYVGSWSGWSSDPSRPVATGDTP
jgi:thiosulfate/3-mercaptopyruvate sulfurtransferase